MLKVQQSQRDRENRKKDVWICLFFKWRGRAGVTHKAFWSNPKKRWGRWNQKHTHQKHTPKKATLPNAFFRAYASSQWCAEKTPEPTNKSGMRNKPTAPNTFFSFFKTPHTTAGGDRPCAWLWQAPAQRSLAFRPCRLQTWEISHGTLPLTVAFG